ncbi:MAG: S1 RNA-binding domain-containing protein [Candidatus Pacebacteria bacterium]|nr:S1 RNA-binding domain-containing protein [Candidatus Paceibacterota bacterium]
MTTKEEQTIEKTPVKEKSLAYDDGSTNTIMSSIIKRSPTPPETGTIIEGPVVNIDKASLFIDLPPFGTGIIYGREFMNARDIIRKINIGDTIAAKIVETENEDGYIELSLKEARQAIIWEEAEQAIISKAVLNLLVKDANKGGLILDWQGIHGFLPASQLKPEHYPRVEDGDKDKILEELKKFVDDHLSVSIIAANPKEGKLIFSEKDSEQKEKTEMIQTYKVGDELPGEVTGVVDFGVFVKVEEGLEGLVHISEIDWGLVKDPRTMYKIGDSVKVKVIEVKDGKISLSIKALKENPWTNASKKYKKGVIVKGVVIKFNQYGALVSIEEGVAGLAHISEFGSEESLREKLELGKTYPFQITFFEPKEQKMTLSFMDESKKTEKKEPEEEKVKEKEEDIKKEKTEEKDGSAKVEKEKKVVEEKDK